MTSYVFGRNDFGQLGTNDTLSRSTPTFSMRNVLSIYASPFSSFVIQNDTCYSISPLSSNVCSGNGVCASIDNCVCYSNFTGATCSNPICYGKSSTDPTVCSGFGTCIAPNTCNCNQTTGNNCQYQTYAWKTGTTGNWSNIQNWVVNVNGTSISATRYPGNLDSIVIDASGTYTVFLDVDLNLTFVSLGSSTSFPTLSLDSRKNTSFSTIIVASTSALNIKNSNITFQTTTFNGMLNLNGNNNLLFNLDTTFYGLLNYQSTDRFTFVQTATFGNSTQVTFSQFSFSSSLAFFGTSELLIDTSSLFSNSIIMKDSSFLSIPSATFIMNGDLNITSTGTHIGNGLLNSQKQMYLNISNGLNSAFYIGINSSGILTLNGGNFYFYGQFLSQVITINSYVEMNAISTFYSTLNGQGSLSFKGLSTAVFPSSCLINIPITLYSNMNFTGATFNITNSFSMSNGSTLYISSNSNLYILNSYSVSSSTLTGGGNLILDTDSSSTFSDSLTNINVILTIYSTNVTFYNGDYYFLNNVTLISTAQVKLSNSILQFINIYVTGNINTFTGDSSSLLNFTSVFKIAGTSNITVPTAIYGYSLISGNIYFLNTLTLNKGSQLEISSGNNVFTRGNTTMIGSQGNIIIGSGTFFSQSLLNLYCDLSCNINSLFDSNSNFIVNTGSYYFNNVVTISNSFNIISKVYISNLATFTSPLIQGNGYMEFSSGSSQYFIGGTVFSVSLTFYSNVTFDASSYKLTLPSSFVQSNININIGGTLENLNNTIVNSTQISGSGTLLLTSGSINFVSTTSRFDTTIILKSNATFNGVFNIYSPLNIQNTFITFSPNSILNSWNSTFITSSNLLGAGQINLSKTNWTGGSIIEPNFFSTTLQTFDNGNYVFKGSSEIDRDLVVTSTGSLEFHNNATMNTYTSNILGGGLILIQSTSNFYFLGTGSISPIIYSNGGNVTFSNTLTFNSKVNLTNSNVQVNTGASISFGDQLNIVNPISMVGPGELKLLQTGSLLINGNINITNVLTVNSNAIFQGSLYFENLVTFLQNSTLSIPLGSSAQFDNQLIYTIQNSLITGQGNMIIGSTGNATFSGSIPNINVNFYSNGQVLFSSGFFNFTLIFNFNQNSLLKINQNSIVEISNQSTLISNSNSLIGTGKLILANIGTLTISGGANISYTIETHSNISLTNGIYQFNGKSTLYDQTSLFISSNSELDLYNDLILRTNYQGFIISGSGILRSYSGILDFGASQPSSFNISLYSYSMSSFSTTTYSFYGYSFFGTTSSFNVTSTIQFYSPLEINSTQNIAVGEGIIRNYNILNLYGTNTTFDINFDSYGNVTILNGIYQYLRIFNLTNTILTIGNTAYVYISGNMFLTQSQISGNGLLTLNVNGYIQFNGNFTITPVIVINSQLRFYPGTYYFTNNASLTPTSQIDALPGSYVEFLGFCNFQTNPNRLTGGGVLRFSQSSALILSGTVSVVNVTFNALSNITFLSGAFYFLQYTSFGPGTTVTVYPNVTVEIQNYCDIYNVNFVGGGTITFAKSSIVTLTGSSNNYDTYFDIQGNLTYTSGNFFFTKNGSLSNSIITVNQGSSIEFDQQVSLNNPTFYGSGQLNFQSNAVNTWNNGALVNLNVLSNQNMIFGSGQYIFNQNFVITNNSLLTIPNNTEVQMNGVTNIQTLDNTFTGNGNLTIGSTGIITMNGGSKLQVILKSNGNITFNGYYTLAKESFFSSTSQTNIPYGSTVQLYDQAQFTTQLNSLIGGGNLILAKNSSLQFSQGSNVSVSITSYTNMNVLSGYYNFNNPVVFNNDAYLSIQPGATAQFNDKLDYNTNQGNITGEGLLVIGINGYANFTSVSPTILDVSINSYNFTNFNSGIFIFQQNAFFGGTSQITVAQSTLQINSVWQIYSNQQTLNGNGLIQLNSGGSMFFSGGPTNIDVVFQSNSNMTFLSGSYHFKKSISTQNSQILIQSGSQVTFDDQTSLISTSFSGSGLSKFSSSSVVNWFGGSTINVIVQNDAQLTFQNGTFIFNGNTTFSQISNTILPFNSTVDFRSNAYLYTTPTNFIGNGTFRVSPTGNVALYASQLPLYFNISSYGQLSFMNGYYFIQYFMNMQQSNTYIDPTSTLEINCLWQVINSPTIIGGGQINLTPRGNILWNTASSTVVNSIITTDSLMTFQSGAFDFQNNILYTNNAQTQILPSATISFDKVVTVNVQTNSFTGGGQVIFTQTSSTSFTGIDTSFTVNFVMNSNVNYLNGIFRFYNSLTMSSTANITVSGTSTLELHSNVDITNNPSSIMGSGTINIVSPAQVTMRGGTTTIYPIINSYSMMNFQTGFYKFSNLVTLFETSQNTILTNTTIQFDNLCNIQATTGNVFSGGGTVIITNVTNQVSGNYQNIIIRVEGTMNQLNTTQVIFDSSMMFIDGILSYQKQGTFFFTNSNMTIGANGVIYQYSGKITYSNALFDVISNMDVLSVNSDSSIIINLGKFYMTTQMSNQTVTTLVPVLNSGLITVSGPGYFYFTNEFVQTAQGTFSLENVNMNITGDLSVTAGILQISGTIQTSFLNVSSNTGIMRMNYPGTLTIIGNCHLLRSTTLIVTIYGTGPHQFDYILVTGILIMESFLYIKLGPNYRPLVFDKVRFMDYKAATISSLVDLIGASYRNGQINKFDQYAEIEVITSIGSVGNLNYTCNYLGNRKIIEYNKFFLSGQISLTLTTPISNGKWVGMGFGPNPNFTGALLIVSTGQTTFQMNSNLQYLPNYNIILDIGANVINTIFNIGPLYQSMSVFLSIYWFQQQNYIFYFELNSSSVFNGTNIYIPNPDVIEYYNYRILYDNYIDCTNFLAPTRAEIYSYYSLGFLLGLYVLLFILCLILFNKQPLKSRGISPYLTLFFLFAQLILEIRNYFYITPSQQTLCLYLGFGIYPLELICYIMTFLYFLRYFAIINVNEKKNDFAKFDKSKKIDRSDQYKRISTFWVIILKILGSFWFPLIVLSISYIFLLILYCIIQAGYGFICRFDTLVFLKLVNTIIMCIMFVAIIILMIYDVIANYNSTLLKCKWINYIIYKDPFYFRVQIFLFFPFLLYCLISELWMFANTFSYKDIVNTFIPSLILNTIQFNILLVIDVVFPILVTFITLIVNFILSRNIKLDSLEEILRNPDTNVMFKKLCEKEYSIENYMSYQDIEEYKKLKSKEFALEIFEKYFLGAESLMEVNVTKQERMIVKEKIDNEQITEKLFDALESSIAVNLADTLSRLIYEKEYIIYKNNRVVKQKMLHDLGI